MTVAIDGRRMNGRKVVRVARPSGAGRFEKAAVSREAQGRIAAARDYIERNWLNDDAPLMYAFNTGVGLFKDVRIPIADMAHYQDQIIRAHATGIGEPFHREVVRATMLLRANAFASAYSGATTALMDRLVGFLNAGLHPVIPQKGSVGASGDLAPLAYLAGAIRGFDDVEVEYRGKVYPAPEAARRAGFEPTYPMGAKEASAIINGSTVSLAVAVLAVEDAQARPRSIADIALALSLEALRGELAAFDPRVHAARPHPGQAKTARNLLAHRGRFEALLGAARGRSSIPDEARDPAKPIPPRVQDVYSLRCAPQVHGPVVDALALYRRRAGDRDERRDRQSPDVRGRPERFVSISGGHFHGAYVGQVMDILAIAMTDLGAISERRLGPPRRPGMSYGLPRNLVAGQRGPQHRLCHGAMLDVGARHGKSRASPHRPRSTAYPARAMPRTMCPTRPMRRARPGAIVANAEQIVAVEMLMAAQALSLVADRPAAFPIGRGGRRRSPRSARRSHPPSRAIAGTTMRSKPFSASPEYSTIPEAVESMVGPLE